MQTARRKKTVRLIAALLAIAIVLFQQIQSASADGDIDDSMDSSTTASSSTTDGDSPSRSSSSSVDESSRSTTYEGPPKLVADPNCKGPEAVAKHDIYANGVRVGGAEGAYVGSRFHGWNEIVSQGDEVEVRFHVEAGCEEMPFALVTYTNVEPMYRPETVHRQVRYDYDTTRANSTDGTQSLKVTIPDCYFQIDFAHDKAYERLTPSTYSKTLIAAATGGSNACANEEPTTTTSSTTSSTTSTTTSTTSTTSTTVAPREVVECPSDPDRRIASYEVHVREEGSSRWEKYDKLEGNVTSNSKVRAKISLAEGCEGRFTLASYEATSTSTTRDSLAEQTLFDHETKNVGDDVATFEVNVPDCYFQVDFATGNVIRDLGEEQYGDRLIDTDVGGEACEEEEVLEETVVKEQPRKATPVAQPQEELAYTGLNMFPMFATAIGLFFVGALFLGSARAMRRRNDWDVW